MVEMRCMEGDLRNAYKILVGKPEGKRPFLNTGYVWEDNIIMNLK
jgi:hypothetical protein